MHIMVDGEDMVWTTSGSSRSSGGLDGLASSGVSTSSAEERAVAAGTGEAPLPPGWRAVKAPSGATYYVNSIAKSTTWERPAPPTAPQATSSYDRASSGFPAVYVDGIVDGDEEPPSPGWMSVGGTPPGATARYESEHFGTKNTTCDQTPEHGAPPTLRATPTPQAKRNHWYAAGASPTRAKGLPPPANEPSFLPGASPLHRHIDLPILGGAGGTSTKSGGWGSGHARFTDSVYVWACGDKANDQEEDIKTSDVMIGWLILVALAYIVLIGHSEGPPDEDISYSLVSVTVAFYLLIATAAPDLRVGFSLLVDGSSACYRFFGAALLAVFGLMITAAMKVLFSSAANDTDVVANAVTVLFIADVDEKALTFFLTVPPKWRLFWATNTVSISVALAVIGLVYVGDASALSAGDLISSEADQRNPVLERLPSWFIFALNPGCCMYIAFVISWSLQLLFDKRDSGGEGGSRLPWGEVFRRVFCGATKAVREEPCLYVVLFVWFVVGVAGWAVSGGMPFAVEVINSTSSSADSSDSSSTGGKVGLRLTSNYFALVAANVALVFGLASLALQRATRQSPNEIPSVQRAQRPEVHDLEQVTDESSDSNNNRRFLCFCTGCLNRSRVPMVLVGWGLGYWATSILYLLGISWTDGGWGSAHIAVSIVGYIVLPLTFLCGIFVIADADFLGAHLEPYCRPVVETLKKPDGILHWTMVTVVRDALVFWLLIAVLVSLSLNFI